MLNPRSVLQMVAGVTLAFLLVAGVAMAQTPTPGAPGWPVSAVELSDRQYGRQ